MTKKSTRFLVIDNRQKGEVGGTRRRTTKETRRGVVWKGGSSSKNCDPLGEKKVDLGQKGLEVYSSFNPS